MTFDSRQDVDFVAGELCIQNYGASKNDAGLRSLYGARDAIYGARRDTSEQIDELHFDCCTYELNSL